MNEKEVMFKGILTAVVLWLPLTGSVFSAETFEEHLTENRRAAQRYEVASDATRNNMKDKWVNRKAEDKKRYEARKQARLEKKEARKSATRTFEDYLAANPKAKKRYDDARPNKQAKMKSRWETRKAEAIQRSKARKIRLAEEKEKRMAVIQKRKEEWAGLSAEKKRMRVKARKAKKGGKFGY